jgi:hypothetical protein
MTFYDLDSEFMRRRVQLINSEGVLRIRELRQYARLQIPCVTQEMQVAYCNAMDNARQIDINCNFLLDMFGAEPLESVSVVKQPEPPKGAA